MQNIKDTYQRITDAVIEQLEAGTKPWIRPWRGNGRGSHIPRRATGEAYRDHDFGGQVRKGERGALVVKYGTFAPKEREDDDDCGIPYFKGYTVFNVEQIENLPESFYRPAEALPTTPVPQLDTVEAFIHNTGASVTYGGTTACYRPATDDILLPARERFLDEGHWCQASPWPRYDWPVRKLRLRRRGTRRADRIVPLRRSRGRARSSWQYGSLLG